MFLIADRPKRVSDLTQLHIPAIALRLAAYALAYGALGNSPSTTLLNLQISVYHHSPHEGSLLDTLPTATRRGLQSTQGQKAV